VLKVRSIAWRSVDSGGGAVLISKPLALVIGLAALVACPVGWSLAQEADDVPLLLATGDTAEAIDLLRQRVTNRSPAEEQCLLATLLTRTVTSLHEDWKARAEAKRWFDRSLRKRNDPLCLLEYSEQRIRVDAGRPAGHATRAWRSWPTRRCARDGRGYENR
jgi:hypothetical protein